MQDAGSITIKRTATINSNEDADAAAGWSIANTYVFYSGGWGTSSSNKPLLVAVKGTVYAGSNDATLSALTVNDGTNDLTLTPTFAPGTTTYTAPVVNSVDEITIAPTVNDSNATYEVQNNSGTALTDADTATAGFQVALSVGANIIKVEVTAQDALHRDLHGHGNPDTGRLRDRRHLVRHPDCRYPHHRGNYVLRAITMNSEAMAPAASHQTHSRTGPQQSGS